MIATIRDHTFFAKPLGPGRVVVDLGANKGDFAREVVARYGVDCVAVEAARGLAEGIAERPGLRVRHAAIAERDGEVRLHVADNPESSSLFAAGITTIATETVPALTLESLLAQEGIDAVALAKVDIEGAELALFTEAPAEVLRRVAQFSVEFHDFTGALSKADIGAVVRRLHDLGFEAIRFSARNGNWLFFQPAASGVGPMRTLLTRHVVRNVRGVGVRAARRLRR